MGDPISEYPMVSCKICGDREQAYYTDDIRNRMVSRQLCFTCLFWTEHIENHDDQTVVIVKGVRYHMAPEDDKPGRGVGRGFGGSRFVIRFFDGREVVSTNLWCQGGIPERFKSQLPDNAEFVSNKKRS